MGILDQHSDSPVNTNGHCWQNCRLSIMNEFCVFVMLHIQKHCMFFHIESLRVQYRRSCAFSLLVFDFTIYNHLYMYICSLFSLLSIRQILGHIPVPTVINNQQLYPWGFQYHPLFSFEGLCHHLMTVTNFESSFECFIGDLGILNHSLIC